jgi:hypothetical protein
MPNTDRQYDLVVWGATGVAGSVVAEYLTEKYTPEDYRSQSEAAARNASANSKPTCLKRTTRGTKSRF